MRRNEPTRIFPRPYFNPQIAEHNSPATRAPRPSAAPHPSCTTLRNCGFLIFNPPDGQMLFNKKKGNTIQKQSGSSESDFFFNILNGNTIHKKFVTIFPCTYSNSQSMYKYSQSLTVFVFAFSYLLWLLIDTHINHHLKKRNMALLHVLGTIACTTILHQINMSRSTALLYIFYIP